MSCDLCGDDTRMLHTCRYCKARVCPEHLLPENHNCPGLRTDTDINTWAEYQKRFDSDRRGDRGKTVSRVRRKQTKKQRDRRPPKKTSGDGEYHYPESDRGDDSGDSDGSEEGEDAKQDKRKRKGPEPVKPKYTVGNTPEPEWSPSPDTKLKSDPQKKEEILSREAKSRIKSWALLVVCAAAVGLLITASVSAGGHTGYDSLIGDTLPEQPAIIPGPGGDNTTEVRKDPATEKDAHPRTTRPQETKQSDEPAADAEYEERLERAVHSEVNSARKNNQQAPISFDTRLADMARAHSEDMGARSYFSHDSPDGTSMGDRYDRHPYSCRISTGGGSYATGAENLFKITASSLSSPEETAEVVVEEWMASPGHRDNLLAPYWKAHGIGVHVETDGDSITVYVTQNFC